MWYYAWILGILLACSFGIINGLWFEQTEANKKEAEKAALQEENNED
ncbi:cytochrome bd-I oxidase subunit CydX [Psychromonas aquimarina]|nr:cytochrome bd-I oxidase subunit CydX [Psychromonas aquimarina]